MKITIISGSPRPKGQSHKVARFLKQTLLDHDLAQRCDILSLADNPIPLWDEVIWSGDPEWKARLQPLSDELVASDAFVVISPEYHGMVPAALKNFFLCFGRNELAHKPALIVAVSSADGGAYPVAELRSSSYKNSRICYIPEHLIIRNVESVLNDDPADNNPDADAYFRDRSLWALKQLHAYGAALATVRESGVTDMSDYSNGM